jgi:hypothetical protein
MAGAERAAAVTEQQKKAPGVGLTSVGDGVIATYSSTTRRVSRPIRAERAASSSTSALSTAHAWLSLVANWGGSARVLAGDAVDLGLEVLELGGGVAAPGTPDDNQAFNLSCPGPAGRSG